jgi:hypothetical protein
VAELSSLLEKTEAEKERKIAELNAELSSARYRYPMLIAGNIERYQLKHYRLKLFLYSFKVVAFHFRNRDYTEKLV